MIAEKLRNKLLSREPAFGISVRFHDPAIIESIAPTWDFIWMDMQHGTIETEHLLNMIRACDLTGVAAFPRLPGLEIQLIGQVLDKDPAGVIVPQVDTPDQARAIVNGAKFPPLGDRSYGGRRIIDRNGRNYVDCANERQLLILQVESLIALEYSEEIAAIDGVDGLMVGPDDLRMRLGLSLSGSLLESEFVAAEKSIADACQKHGKYCLTFARSREEIETVVNLGFQMIDLGSDVAFLKEASSRVYCLSADWRQEESSV